MNTTKSIHKRTKFEFTLNKIRLQLKVKLDSRKGSLFCSEKEKEKNSKTFLDSLALPRL